MMAAQHSGERWLEQELAKFTLLNYRQRRAEHVTMMRKCKRYGIDTSEHDLEKLIERADALFACNPANKA